MIDLWRKEAYSSFIKPEKSPGGNFLSSIGIIWAQREMTLTTKSQKKQTFGYQRFLLLVDKSVFLKHYARSEKPSITYQLTNCRC